MRIRFGYYYWLCSWIPQDGAEFKCVFVDVPSADFISILISDFERTAIFPFPRQDVISVNRVARIVQPNDNFPVWPNEVAPHENSAISTLIND